MIRITHVLFHFGIGGLENGLVNLINHLDASTYRHSIVCLSGFDETYLGRIKTDNYDIVDLEKRPGNDPRTWIRFLKHLKTWKPDIVHTRNFASLEMQALALVSGVKFRIHGEHGWDVQDPNGENRKYRILRRLS